MPTSLSYFSNKYRCHEQFVQHKSSFARLTCRQSIYICHVIVLNTLSVLENVFLEVYISHWLLWFHLIEWNHLVWQTHTCCSQQICFIQIKTNQSYQHWEPVGVGVFQGCPYPDVSHILRRVEGYGLQKADESYQCTNESKNNKNKLTKIRRKKNLCLFFFFF